jgi:hypothetical protein
VPHSAESTGECNGVRVEDFSFPMARMKLDHNEVRLRAAPHNHTVFSYDMEGNVLETANDFISLEQQTITNHPDIEFSMDIVRLQTGVLFKSA